MIRRPTRVLFVVGALSSAAVLAQDGPPREPTDVHIRRSAGLPAESARGANEILDVGQDPGDTMLSIVARRSDAGWTVSYACAASPYCARETDHFSREYVLSTTTSQQVDSLLDKLRQGGEPDDNSQPGIIGGWAQFSINDRGFRHRYRRVMDWGPTLGLLESLLKSPS